jgi:hypothetical protein
VAEYLYTAASIEYLLERYYNERRSLDLVEHYLDIERALLWLNTRQPVLAACALAWARGMPERDLAALHHVSEEDLHHYLTLIFTQMARLLNNEETFL